MSRTIAEVERLLAEAKLAYHRLQIGELPLFVVDQNGEQVRFNRANLGALAAYIRDLEQELADLKGLPRTVGPMRVWVA